MIALSIRGLPKATTEASLTTVFSEYGVVRSLKLVKDLYTVDCKGFATIEMEGHEARAAIAALNGSFLDGSMIRVMQDDGSRKRGAGRRRH